MLLQYFAISIYEKNSMAPLKYIIKGGYGPGGYYTVVMLQIIMLFPFIYSIIKKYKCGVIFIVLLNIFLEFIWSIFLSPIGGIPELYLKEIYRLLAFRYLGFIAVGAWYAKIGEIKNILYKLKFIIGIFGIIIIYLWQYAGVKTYIFDNEWASTTLPCIFIAFAYFLMIKEISIKKHKFVTELSKSTFHIYLFQMCYFGFVVPVIAKLIDKKTLLLLSIFISIPICFFGGYLFYKCEYTFRRILNRTEPK